MTEISKEAGAKPFSLKKLEGTVLDKLEKAGGKKRKDLRKIFKKEVSVLAACLFPLAQWFPNVLLSNRSRLSSRKGRCPLCSESPRGVFILQCPAT